MPVASVNGVDLYYETSGTGFPLVLAHGYCTSINLWGSRRPISPAIRWAVRLALGLRPGIRK